MTKHKPSKSPATNNIVKTVAGALGVNIKRSERLQAKRQGHSQVSHLDFFSSEVVTFIKVTPTALNFCSENYISSL